MGTGEVVSGYWYCMQWHKENQCRALRVARREGSGLPRATQVHLPLVVSSVGNLKTSRKTAE